MKWLSLVILIGLFVFISIYVGKYIYNILFKTKSFVDPVMDKVDKVIYKVAGIEDKEMNWKEYIRALLTTNIIMIVIIFILLMVQQFIVGATNPSLNMNYHTALLALAVSMKEKRLVAEGAVSFRTDTSLFVGVLIAVILVIGALTFLPLLVLEPGAEFLTIS